LEQSFAQARRTGNLVALVYLDLDGFKDVNDSLGHNMGDELLRAVSSRLSNQLREQDTIARLGGDEFAIVISSVKQAEDVAAIAQKILDCLTMSFNLKTYSIHIGASVGISLYPDDGLSVEDILKHADAAMYQAKHAGKNRYSFFTPQLNQHIIEQLKLENDMRHGLEHGEFFLHYQPRIHLSTKHIHSVEALLRWKHPVRGLISPGLFIPIAEKTGLILPLTKYVLYLAAAQAKAWLSEGRDLRVAINLSAKCFQHPDLIPMLQDTLNAHDLEAKYLELEITESAAMDDVESNITTLNQLRDMGFYIAIDDFGTAYSSLNYLKRLPVNCLKIDRSFIKDISFKTLDSVDTAIVKAIVALGKALDFHLVAEGVETLEQANFLQFLGCYEAQGFYFCKPLPASELFQAEQSVIELM
jgi:diguanylate cyclase (GGDEF)-like protein